MLADGCIASFFALQGGGQARVLFAGYIGQYDERRIVGK